MRTSKVRRVVSDNSGNRQLELFGEFVVALVVGRDGHYGARTVARQDVIGNPDWDLGLGNRVYGVSPGEDPGLVAVSFLTFDVRFGLGRPRVLGDGVFLVTGRQDGHQRVFWRQHQESGPE